jgi:hypothetical protein
MDRLLRLLPKKHSVFKDFAHQLSEAIFVRDQDDEDSVRAVIEKKGGKWSYMLRAHSAALHKRIRRFIPSPEILVQRLRCLFNAYKNVKCPTASGKKANFFSEEAWKMAERLLVTAQLGFLSDPLDIPLYYLIGRDRDGLNIYRCIRGTNSVEGGWHMTLRRMFGSLGSASEFGEALIITFAYRRNITVSAVFLFLVHALIGLGRSQEPHRKDLQRSLRPLASRRNCGTSSCNKLFHIIPHSPPTLDSNCYIGKFWDYSNCFFTCCKVSDHNTACCKHYFAPTPS